MKYGSIAFVAALLAGAGSANADIFTFEAFLSGPAESPPNVSPGTGYALVTWDTAAHTMHLQVTFSGLLGTVTASHIHAGTATPNAGTAGVATTTPTFPGFPSGVMTGSYDQTFDMSLASSYNPAFVTANGNSVPAAEAALLAALQSSRAYLNIHSSVSPGGEIRGFLPSPGAAAVVGLGGLVAARRRRVG